MVKLPSSWKFYTLYSRCEVFIIYNNWNVFQAFTFCNICTFCEKFRMNRKQQNVCYQKSRTILGRRATAQQFNESHFTYQSVNVLNIKQLKQWICDAIYICEQHCLGLGDRRGQTAKWDEVIAETLAWCGYSFIGPVVSALWPVKLNRMLTD